VKLEDCWCCRWLKLAQLLCSRTGLRSHNRTEIYDLRFCVCDSLICLRFFNTGKGWNRWEKWKCQHTKYFSWGWCQSTKHSWLCCNNKEVEVSKCTLLSACGFHAKLTGFHLKLGRRDVSFEVILMPAIAVRISKSGMFTYGCCSKSCC